MDSLSSGLAEFKQASVGVDGVVHCFVKSSKDVAIFPLHPP